MSKISERELGVIMLERSTVLYRYVCTTQQIDSPGLTLIDQRSVTTLGGFIKKG